MSFTAIPESRSSFAVHLQREDDESPGRIGAFQQRLIRKRAHSCARQRRHGHGDVLGEQGDKSPDIAAFERVRRRERGFVEPTRKQHAAVRIEYRQIARRTGGAEVEQFEVSPGHAEPRGALHQSVGRDHSRTAHFFFTE